MRTGKVLSWFSVRSRVAVFASGLFGLAAFAAFARATPTGIFSGDVAEFQLLGLTGGLAHANGYPVYITLANLFGLLPIGPLAEASYRINLFSAVFGALTVGLLALFVVREHAAVDGRTGREWTGIAAGLFAGLAFALTSLTWALATVALPYTLDTAAMLVVLLLVGAWARGARAWALYAGLLVYGTSFGVHPDTVLLAPGLAVLILWRLWPERRTIGRVVPLAALSFVAGIAVYVAAWAFQDARHVSYDFMHTIGWVAPDTWAPSMRTSLDRFIFQATTQHGRQAFFAVPLATVIEKFLGYWVGLLSLFTPIGVALAGVGLVGTVRRRPALGLALILTFVAQLTFWLGDEIGDLDKHLLPNYLLLALWIGLGTAEVLRLVETLVARRSNVHSVRRVLGTAAGLGVAAALAWLVLLPGARTSWPVVAGKAPVDYTPIKEWNVPKDLGAPRAYARQALAQLPQNAVFFGPWGLIYTLAYVAQFQEGRRDILTVNQAHYAKEAAVRQYAAARPTYFSPPPNGRPPQRWLPGELLGRLTPGSPLYALRTSPAAALYRVDVDMKTGRPSGTFRRLTRGPDDERPVISPDGKQIAYRFVDQDAAGVALLDVSSGATRRVLARPPSPGQIPDVLAWRSPQELLVYDAGAAPPGFAALNVRDGALRPISAAAIARRDFVYVPQTQEVLYALGSATTPGVVLKARSLATGAERAVATIDFLIGFLVSPDGRHVVYNRYQTRARPGVQGLPAGGIFLMAIDGTPEKLLGTWSSGSESQTLAAWSADAKFLLLVAGNSVPRVVNVETLAGRTLAGRALLASPNQPGWYFNEATWAPDGSFVVMPGVADEAARLLVVGSPVAAPHALASNEPVVAQAGTAGPFKALAFHDTDESGSPNGALVVGHKDDAAGRLYLRDLKTAVERVLVDLEGTVDHLVWSPDSQRLAFTFTPKAPATAEVRVVTVVTGESRALAASGSVLAWTARNEILVSASRPPSVDYLLIPAAGGAPRTIFAPTRGQVTTVRGIVDDGASLILDEGRRLVSYDLSSDMRRRVTTIDAREQFLALSPDGRLIAFASDMEGGWAVYVAPLDPLPVKGLVRVASLDTAPDNAVAWWTPAGVLALAHVTYSVTALHRVEINPTTGRASGPFRRLTRGPYDDMPVISPDGKLIKYWFDDQNAGGVALLDVSSGASRVLALRPSPGQSPDVFAWRSPEELLLYDAGAAPPGFAALNVRDGALRPLSAAAIARRDFVYVPQTQAVLYASGNANTPGVALTARSLASGADRVVTTIDFLANFRASPDGRHVAYSHWLTAPGQRGVRTQRASEMRLMTIDGVPEKLLLATPAGRPDPAAWSPDGKFLLYYVDSTPRVMNVQTLESWALLDSPNQPGWYYSDAAWAPDGSFVVMPGDGTRQEPHPLAWEGVTYEAVMRLLARANK